ncbi:MAG TPA: phosphoribosylamine--glycine ligase [Candidatus Limnocylindrales bacterium]|nr:phosphoribosylamine--glycine ligase [Candidatus Limnocylindrales bacterium]
MRILVLGAGGREHALAWKIAQSTAASGDGIEVFAAPGNPGIASVATCVPLLTGNPESYLAAARAIKADLTVVGPEAPLAAGVVDAFRAEGRRIVGPTAEGARLESSKVFAKNFFVQSSIPTARYEAVEDVSRALPVVESFGYPVVLKADGLAAGKGVAIVRNRAEAEAALGALSGPLVVEEFLTGEEVSFIALCDGRDAVALAPTQDHKAAFDGDTGPNTGGMGAYCDSAILSAAQSEDILNRVIRPTVERTAFTGFLYAGLMMTVEGPKVLEFNVRLGDPETQPLMHRLASDFVPALVAAAQGGLGDIKLNWRPEPSVCVVLATDGYPGAYETGKPIEGVEAAEREGAVVFHAGTRLGIGGLETAGGRVLGVTASGGNLPAAIDHAYAGVRRIKFEGMHYRRDIGHKGLERYNGKDATTRARSSDG